MKRIIVSFILLLKLFLYSYIYGLTTLTIDNKDNLTTDDIFELTITTDQIDVSDLDTSSITNDFDIINQSQQVYHSIINGQSSSKIQWVVAAKAKDAGVFTIPGIKLGKDHTNSLTLNISKPVYDPNIAAEVFINLTANDNEIFVNTPLRINVSINISNDIKVRNLDLKGDENTGLELYKIDESNKQIFHKSKRYTQVNVTYLVFINKTGIIEIPHFTLSGLKVKSNNRTNDLFALYQQRWTPFQKSSPRLQITVKNNPAAEPNTPLLAADNIIVEQSWSNQSQDIKLGDAIQRTIKVTGYNIPNDQLPALYPSADSLNMDHYKVYIDKPERSSIIEGQKLVSTLSQSITYITTKPGNVILNAKNFTWWNNNTKSIVKSTIEGKSFNILTTPTLSDPNNTDTSLELTNKQDLETSNEKSQLQNNIEGISEQVTPNGGLSAILYKSFWLIITALLITIALLIIFIMMLIKRLNNRPLVSFETNNSSSKSKSLGLLSSSQLKNDINRKLSTLKTNLNTNKQSICYQAIYDNLVDISNSLYPASENSFKDFRDKLPVECHNDLNTLMELLYSDAEHNSLDSSKFYNNFSKYIKNELNRISHKIKNKQVDDILELYPE